MDDCSNCGAVGKENEFSGRSVAGRGSFSLLLTVALFFLLLRFLCSTHSVVLPFFHIVLRLLSYTRFPYLHACFCSWLRITLEHSVRGRPKSYPFVIFPGLLVGRRPPF